METQTQKQNLLNQVSSVTITRPPGFYKSIVLDALTVLAALATGWFFSGFVSRGTGYGFFLLSAGIFMILSLLSTLFTKWLGRRSFIVVLECLALVVFFTGEEVRLFLVALGLLLVFFFWGEIAGRRGLHNALTVQFFRVVRLNFSKVTTGIILAYLVLYYPHLDRENALVPKAAFAGVFDWGGGVVRQFYGDIDLSGPLDRVVKRIYEINLNQDPSYKALTPPQREQAIAEQVRTFIASLSESIGYAIEAQQTVEDVFYGVFTKTLNDLKIRFGPLFFVGWVVAIFVVIRGLGAIFYWAIGGLAFFIYQMLLSLNFVTILNEPKSQEVIEY